jgi:hypothetical protein
MSLQEAVLHGQLSARELEGVLRDLHRDITLSPADEQQIKGKRSLTPHPRSLASHTDSSTHRACACAMVRARACACTRRGACLVGGWHGSSAGCRSVPAEAFYRHGAPTLCVKSYFLVHLSKQPSFHTHTHTHTYRTRTHAHAQRNTHTTAHAHKRCVSKTGDRRFPVGRPVAGG